jgi:hypothetical protein
MGSNIVVNGSGAVTTDFMKVAGFPNLNFNTSPTAAWGNVRMRVAMGLDVTGSMRDDGKMPAMQTAAKSLIDQLSALAKNPGDIYISIVPFAKDVNMGASNYDQSWIGWTDWDNDNGSCSSSSYSSKNSCLNHDQTWNVDHTKWTGCFTDRDRDFDTKNTTPTASNTSTLFPAEEYVSGSEKYCKVGNNPYLQPIMPLSYDRSALKTLIDGMEPTGNTNQGIGLAWASMTLGTGAPFNAPRQGPQLYLQGRDHPSVGRFEHAKPLVQQCFPDRRPPETAVRQRQGRRHHDLYHPRQYRRRSNLAGVEILRQRHRQVLPDHQCQPDGRGVQLHRHIAVEAACRPLIPENREQEKSPAITAGLFDSWKTI